MNYLSDLANNTQVTGTTAEKRKRSVSGAIDVHGMTFPIISGASVH